MATNRECNCISIVTDILGDSNTLYTTSIIALHHGNIKYKKNISPGPLSAKGLYDDITISTKKLLEKIPEYNRECDTNTNIPEEQDRFKRATTNLDKITKKKELNSDDVLTTFYSSLTINDVLSRAIKKHNLIQCK